MHVDGGWTSVLEGKAREELETDILPLYLAGCRWFGGKARRIERLTIPDALPVRHDNTLAVILLMAVEYEDGLPETYLLPLSFAAAEDAGRIRREHPQAIVSLLTAGGTEGILYDGLYSEPFCTNLLSLIAEERTVKGREGELVAYQGKAFGIGDHERETLLKPHVLKAEQTNTSVLYGNRFFLKVYRHPAEGINPDLEIARFLTEKAAFPNIPPFAGGIEYRRPGMAEPMALGILQGYVSNRGDSWEYFLQLLKSYYERVSRGELDTAGFPRPSESFLDLASVETPAPVRETLTPEALVMAGLLGTRTGQLHLALASDREDGRFAPEPYSADLQRSMALSAETLAENVFVLLERNLDRMPEGTANGARELLGFKKRVLEGLRTVLPRELTAMRIRIHGDFHLGQALFTGDDFVIIDFEGEPARVLVERRLKKSPLVDVAGMIRSFHYAAHFPLITGSLPHGIDSSAMEPWAELWYRWAAGVFLRAYLDVVRGSGILPEDRDETELLLKAFLLEKAVYELGYELNNRPEWMDIPMRGVRQLIERRHS